jgi:hypothetical protein
VSPCNSSLTALVPKVCQCNDFDLAIPPEFQKLTGQCQRRSMAVREQARSIASIWIGKPVGLPFVTNGFSVRPASAAALKQSWKWAANHNILS